ncbi:MAG: M48 family metallopeptidase [Methanobacteriaceae archaeon]|jgi:predicted metal-dependent hydrolase
MTDNIKIHDLEVEYKIIHRDIKYPRLELKTGDLFIIVPQNFENPEKLINKHEKWIYTKLSIIKRSMKDSKDKKLNKNRTEEELRYLVDFFADEMSIALEVEIKNIRFRLMKTKWGSCSSRGNININKLLKYLPEDLIRYVVFHEMAHLIEQNHNKNFWIIISKKFPDYEMMEKELLDYWFLIQTEL